MRASAMLALCAGTIATVSGGLALRAGGTGPEAWYISRASGLVAFTLLTANVVLGLSMSTGIGKRLLAARMSYDLHGFLSVLTLVFLAVHGGSLLFDGFFAFTPLTVLVPFVSPYAPFWTGLGVVAGWSAAIVAASVRVRSRVGYRTWRQLHYLSFAAYVLAMLHGISAGSDTAVAGVQALYLGSAGLVTTLLLVRILAPRNSRRPTASGARTPAAQGR